MAWVDSGGGRTIVSHNGGVAMPKAMLAGTVSYGDLIGTKSATNGMVRSDADVAAGPVDGEFIAALPGDSGDVISVVTEAEIRFDCPSADAIAVGTKLYASAVAGRYVDAKPDATQGDATSVLGTVVEKASDSKWFLAIIKTHPGKHGYTYKP